MCDHPHSETQQTDETRQSIETTPEAPEKGPRAPRPPGLELLRREGIGFGRLPTTDWALRRLAGQLARARRQHPLVALDVFRFVDPSREWVKTRVFLGRGFSYEFLPQASTPGSVGRAGPTTQQRARPDDGQHLCQPESQALTPYVVRLYRDRRAVGSCPAWRIDHAIKAAHAFVDAYREASPRAVVWSVAREHLITSTSISATGEREWTPPGMGMPRSRRAQIRRIWERVEAAHPTG